MKRIIRILDTLNCSYTVSEEGKYEFCTIKCNKYIIYKKYYIFKTELYCIIYDSESNNIMDIIDIFKYSLIDFNIIMAAKLIELGRE